MTKRCLICDTEFEGRSNSKVCRTEECQQAWATRRKQKSRQRLPARPRPESTGTTGPPLAEATRLEIDRVFLWPLGPNWTTRPRHPEEISIARYRDSLRRVGPVNSQEEGLLWHTSLEPEIRQLYVDFTAGRADGEEIARIERRAGRRPSRIAAKERLRLTTENWKRNGWKRSEMLATDEKLAQDAEQLAQMAREVLTMAVRWQARFPNSDVLAATVETFLREALASS